VAEPSAVVVLDPAVKTTVPAGAGTPEVTGMLNVSVSGVPYVVGLFATESVPPVPPTGVTSTVVVAVVEA
jgi:hypothetical protein